MLKRDIYFFIVLVALLAPQGMYAIIGDIVHDTVGGAANVAGAAVNTAANVTSDVVGEPYYREGRWPYRDRDVLVEEGVITQRDDAMAPIEAGEVSYAVEPYEGQPVEEPFVRRRPGRRYYNGYDRDSMRRSNYRQSDAERHLRDPHSKEAGKWPARN